MTTKTAVSKSLVHRVLKERLGAVRAAQYAHEQGLGSPDRARRLFEVFEAQGRYKRSLARAGKWMAHKAQKTAATTSYGHIPADPHRALKGHARTLMLMTAAAGMGVGGTILARHLRKTRAQRRARA